MPKIVESKLVFKGDDQISQSLKTITQELLNVSKAAETVTQRLSEIEVRGGRGGGRGVVAQPSIPYGGRAAGRSPNAPGIDAIKTAGGAGWGQKPWFGWRGTGGGSMGLGIAARLPGMAGSVVSGGAGGGGLQPLSQMMSQAGGGITGALGGLGAAVGIPLLIGGAMLGIAHMASAPYRQYAMAGGDLSARLGHGFLENMRTVGKDYGFSSAETVRWMGQMERFGGMQAFPVMGKMRWGMGMAPDQAAQYFETLSRAGAAGGRRKEDYEFLGKMFKTAIGKDTSKIAEYLELALPLFEQMGQSLGDMDKQQTLQTMGLAKWLEASGSAAFRGSAGARVMGGLYNWIGTPGTPGKEMFIWSALAGNASFREAIAASTYNKQGGMEWRGIGGGPMSYFQFMRARSHPAAITAMLGAFSGLPGEWGPLMLTKAGIAPNIADKLLSYYKGHTPDEVTRALEKGGSLSGVMDEMKQPTDPLQKLIQMESALENVKVNIGEKIAPKVISIESSLASIAGKTIDKVKTDRFLDVAATALEKLDRWLGDRPETKTDKLLGKMNKYYPEKTVTGQIGRLIFEFFSRMEEEEDKPSN